MAGEDARVPSPPLPPDPWPQKSTTQAPPVDAQSQPPRPATPVKDKTDPNLERVDSSQSPQSARESPVLQHRQPIKDAVNHAANNVFEHSPVTNQLDPEFVRNLTAQVTAQVTEQVLHNLQAVGAAPAPQQPAPTAPAPPLHASAQSQEPRSPTQSSVDSTSSRFTPPTPDRNREGRDDRGYGSTSPGPALSDVGSSFSRRSEDSIRSDGSKESRDTPRPFKTDSSGGTRGSSTAPNDPSGMTMDENQAAREASNSSESTARERTPYRQRSRDSAESFDGASRSPVRPPPVIAEETPLEKVWQPLFDKGNPTMRLSQFLRGLALHLIDDHEPKGSLVVTPAKMLHFFNETKIANEIYPWDTIFGGKLSTISISLMYQKLLCQHHLIQDRYDKAPWVPALTPSGFDWFMTCLIQAHPDLEYERFAKAVMNMPISNADNKSERFPKELSQRLFPAEPNLQAEQRLVSSLNHEPYVVNNLKGSSSMPPPPPPPASGPPNSFSNERERKPYSQTSRQSNGLHDDDSTGRPSVQIERERKPYTAREGAGKVYGDEGRTGRNPSKAEAPSGSTRPSRPNSGLPSQGLHSDPINIPQRNPHRMSAGQGSIPPPVTNGGYSRPSRRSSPPPMRNPNIKSEPDFVGSTPNSQMGSNIPPSHLRDKYPVDSDDEAARRYRSRSRTTTAGNPVEDDPRGYPIPGCGGVPISHGYEYGGSGGPPPLGGSYPSRWPGSVDDRRRSMFSTPTAGFGAGEGGTDGYGSFTGMNPYPPPPPQRQPSYGTSPQH